MILNFIIDKRDWADTIKLHLIELNGGVPERFIGAVLKTVVRDERTVGSNPTSSW